MKTELNDELLYDGLDEALKLKLKDQLFDLISAKGCETFAEIQNHNIEGFQGQYVFTWEDRPDLVLWTCLSKEAVAAFTEFLVEKRIFPHSANPLIYSYGGMMVDLPIAKHPSHAIAEATLASDNVQDAARPTLTMNDTSLISCWDWYERE